MIWELSGELGIDPGSRTLRELLWMAHGRRRQSWNYLSSLMALTANCHASKGKKFTAKDFNPMVEKSQTIKLSPRESVDALLKVFVKNGS